MSERPQFTNESPVRRDDECVDAGEDVSNEEMSQHRSSMRLGAFAIEVLGLIKMPPLRKWRRILRMLVEGGGNSYENGVDIAYGLNGSSVDMCVNVPSRYPLSAKQIEERRKIANKILDPNYRKREKEFIQRMRKAEQKRRSSDSAVNAS